MAGMETLEIHSRSYLIRWVDVNADNTIAWSIQPHKKSINFGLFKHPGPQVSLLPHDQPSATSAPSSPNIESDGQATAVDKLKAIGLKQVLWHGKCEADKITQGSHEIVADNGGNYALVFDNTFSKQISKTATLALLIYPTQHPPQLGAQVHHSVVTGPATLPPYIHKDGIAQWRKQNGWRDQPPQTLAEQTRPRAKTNPSAQSVESSLDSPPSVHTGILHKRRRKKHQGHARRFFSLDFTSSTLSYYHDKNSSALRGAIPLSLAAIGANAKTRELSIDSGAEIWHLRALSQSDFQRWKKCFERASRIASAATSLRQSLSIDTHIPSSTPLTVPGEQDWVRAESLISRVAGTRDALRRLCRDTEISLQAGPPSQPASSASSPVEASGDDFFKPEGKRPFWKRNTSGSASLQSSRFRRNNAPTQLTVPPLASKPLVAEGSDRHSHSHEVEQTMNDHCRALLRDLDSAVSDFSALVAESKARRVPDPKSAKSRVSVNSVDSQEYFDAPDAGTAPIFEIPDASEEDLSSVERDVTVDDSDGSSDFEQSGEIISGRGFRSGSLTSIFPDKAKTLTPLPLPSAQRRTNVAASTIMPPSLIGFLRKNVGKDLSSISMPVSANEPTSLLQRSAEQLEYSSLLDDAAKATDRVERLIYVTAFAISSLSGARAKERAIRKPFNPMLGETFELVREDKGFRLVAEKVSHRPVQLAICTQAADWSFAHSPLPSQKFWGKSAEIVADGQARIVLHAHDECFSWSPATSFLRNIIAGEKYVEPVGSMTVVNETAGLKASVNFKAKGMFSGRSEEVQVTTFDVHGQLLPLGLQGTWTESLRLTENGKLKDNTIWCAGSLVDQAAKHYGMTRFAATLNEVTATEEGKLPPSDSRTRPDQRALEDGDHEQAEDLKACLEEKQRSRRKDMEAAGKEWKPRWFTSTKIGDEVVWKMKTGKDGYWEERARGTWNGVVPVTQS